MGGGVYSRIEVGDADPQPSLSRGAATYAVPMITNSPQARSLPHHPRPPRPKILDPFDKREGMSVAEYASQRDCSKPTAREEVNTQGLGRKLGGRWQVSRVLAAMYLNGDKEAMTAYWRGERETEVVKPYFERLGIDPATLGREVVATVEQAKVEAERLRYVLAPADLGDAR